MENDAYRKKILSIRPTGRNTGMSQITSGLTGTQAKQSTVGYILCKTLCILMALDLCLRKKPNNFKSIPNLRILEKLGPKLTFASYRPTPQFEKANSDTFVKHSSNTQCITALSIRTLRLYFLEGKNACRNFYNMRLHKKWRLKKYWTAYLFL